MELGSTLSLGQLAEEPLQTSARSHLSPEAAARQTPVSSVQVPVEQLWQSFASPPPQAVLQHTPSTQELLVHSWAEPQPAPFAFLGRQSGEAQ